MFRDLGLPWEPEVKRAVQAQRKVLESLGCIVEEAEPDFREANECFLAWRHWSIDLHLATCWLATATSSTSTFIGTLKKAVSSLGPIFHA